MFLGNIYYQHFSITFYCYYYYYYHNVVKEVINKGEKDSQGWDAGFSEYFTYCYICHSVCLEWPFPSSWLGMVRAFASAFHSEWLPPFRWPGTCTGFPTKSRYDVIRGIMWWCTDDVGLWMVTSCHSYIKVGGYKRMNAWGEGVPSSEILGVELTGLNLSPLQCFSMSLHQVNQEFYTL